MINKIDSLIEELDGVCREFDYISDTESDWRVACRISYYSEHVQRGIEGLHKMREYLAGLSEWQLNQIHEAFIDEWQIGTID